MQRRKPYKAKGAVLIMVLTVMFVLIFLLAGAVAVVYSSNRRVMVQYEESQAYYSARSVLDVYHDMILASDDTSKVTGNYYELDKTTYEVTPSTTYPNISSGRALELDLYRVPVSVNATIGEANFNKTFADDYNSVPAGTANDPARAAVVRSRNMTEDVAATATGTNIANYLKQYTVTGSQSSKYSVGDADANQIASVTDWSGASPKYAVGKDDTLVYYVNYDKTKSESNFSKYQGTPTGSNSAANKLTDPGSTVKLTVQVIDRVYDLSTDAAFTTFGDKFIHGNREKDYFLIKVTAEVVYDGQIVTTSAVYENQQRTYPSPPASKAIVSMSDISGSNSLVAFGGGSALGRKDAIITANNMNTEGNIFVQSGFDSGTTDMNMFLDKDSNLFVRGKFKLQNKLFNGSNIKTGAMVYAGEFEIESKGTNTLGDPTGNQVLNIVSPKLTFASSNNLAKCITGRGYFDVIDVYQDSSGNNLGLQPNNMKNGNGIFNKNSGAESGVYYCNYLRVPKEWLNNTQTGFNTNLTNDSQNLNPSVLLANNSTLYICKGIIWNDGTSDQVINLSDTSFDVSTSGQGTIKYYSGGTVKINYDEYTDPGTGNLVKDYTYNSATDQKEFTLPEKMAGKTDNKLFLDTVKSLYKDYFKDDDGGTPAIPTWGTDGDFYQLSSLNTDDLYRDFISSHMLTAEDKFTKLNDNTEAPSILSPTGTAGTSFTYNDPDGNEKTLDSTYSSWSVISGSCYIPSEAAGGKNNGKYIIDARNNPVTIQFGTPASNTGKVVFGGKYIVVGQKDVTVLVPSNNDNTEVVFGTAEGGDFEFVDYDIGENPSSLTLTGTGATKAPNIDWYVSSKVKTVEFDQKTTSALNGYVTAPKTKFIIKNYDGVSPNVYTEEFGTTNIRTLKVCVIGSALCNQFTTDNSKKAGVCYINKANKGSGATPGKPLYSWPAQYYTMN